MRWNLFQLAQASAQVGEQGIAAKGVTGGGYEGHYFWDTEMYVAPFLAYTRPEAARQLMRFRWRMLPTARSRAVALNSAGALYPWRTINGEEASAYYAAGTAQYHIDAAIAFALKRYVDASGDIAFLATDGAEMLVETARMWNDLGFYSARRNGNGNGGTNTFHIHGVTGPDEYTAVVNDNLYTNVMARFNLRYAARVLELLEDSAPDAYAALARRVDLGDHEAPAWVRAAESMYLPYDEELGIHPQDADFLDLQSWDFDATPPDKYPLLLHFHPLVIYRHQVLKQADVVLAMSLRNDQFSPEVRKRNFDYYDPITTGDSSLSACVQAAAAAQIGYGDLAVQYFREAMFVDLADLHGNARDGVHVASTGRCVGHRCLRLRRDVRNGNGDEFRSETARPVRADDVACPAPRLTHVHRARPRRLHRQRRRRRSRADPHHARMDRADARTGRPGSDARHVGGGVAAAGTRWTVTDRVVLIEAGQVAAHLVRRSPTDG